MGKVHLVHEDGDLSSDPQHLHERLGTVVRICNLCARRGQRDHDPAGSPQRGQRDYDPAGSPSQ